MKSKTENLLRSFNSWFIQDCWMSSIFRYCSNFGRRNQSWRFLRISIV